MKVLILVFGVCTASNLQKIYENPSFKVHLSKLEDGPDRFLVHLENVHLVGHLMNQIKFDEKDKAAMVLPAIVRFSYEDRAHTSITASEADTVKSLMLKTLVTILFYGLKKFDQMFTASLNTHGEVELSNVLQGEKPEFNFNIGPVTLTGHVAEMKNNLAYVFDIPTEGFRSEIKDSLEFLLSPHGVNKIDEATIKALCEINVNETTREVDEAFIKVQGKAVDDPNSIYTVKFDWKDINIIESKEKIDVRTITETWMISDLLESLEKEFLNHHL